MASSPGGLVVNGRFLQRPVSGVERVALELVRALARKAKDEGTPELHLLLPAGPSSAAVPGLERRVCSAWLPRGHLWEQFVLPFIAPRATLLSLTNSASLLRLHQCVVVHDASVFDVPESFTAAYRWWYRAQFACLQHTPATVCTVSEFSKERLEHHLPRLAGRVKVVPPGVDHVRHITPADDVPERFGLEQGRFVLAVGSAARHKNQDLILRAAAGIGALGLKVALVGGSRAAVFRDSSSAPSTSNIVRLGYVDDRTLRSLYASAYAFVFPSLYEGFGLPPLEAMALGCPTIVSDVRPLTDHCGNAALRIDPHRPAELVAALRRLRAPVLRQELIERGPAQVAKFTWDAAAQRLLGALSDGHGLVAAGRSWPSPGRQRA